MGPVKSHAPIMVRLNIKTVADPVWLPLISHHESLEVLEAEVRKLPRDEALQLQDFLADFLEDQEALTPEFIASIERGQADLRSGQARVRRD